jgi:hypothetical protein
MKKIFSLIALCVLLLISTSVNSQVLGIDSTATNLNSLPDTININDNYSHSVTIQNFNSTTLTGTIYLVAAVDTSLGLMSIDTVASVSVTNFGLNDTVSLSYTETYNFSNSYKIGGNIVVVWPIANFGNTKDSLFKNVYIKNTVAINEINTLNSSILIYPNPVKNKILIKNPYDTTIKHVRIFNLNRALILDEEYQSEINTEHLTNGMYFLELVFTNKHKEYYKIIKD